SWRAMSERADFRELVRRLVALAVLVVPVELARLFIEGQLVRAVAERLVLRQPAPAEPLLLAVDHVRRGVLGGAFYDTCHCASPLGSPIGWRGAPRRSRGVQRPRPLIPPTWSGKRRHPRTCPLPSRRFRKSRARESSGKSPRRLPLCTARTQCARP